MDRTRRAALRRALLDAEPWLADERFGPTTVDAGSCSRCGLRPRLLATCGPSGEGALCRDCARSQGEGAWCDGHLEQARAALRWADDLPERWADAVVLWWIATGESLPPAPRRSTPWS